MKKSLLTLFALTILFVGCKKDEYVEIDMTSKTYSAGTKFNNNAVILLLDFQSNGEVRLRAYPSVDVVILKYEIGSKTAPTTTLRIYGDLDKTLNADGFTKGSKIEWKGNISRPSNTSEIKDFSISGYNFISY
ncbi:hypothetical protein ABDJ41_12030 [Pedobacter sp. ASV1-7]|uniref:hypothetical protein n=1 Tax=Pedobacter sp. ASV1-7 TaxID=3145237 RepID=UPI0032E86B6D